MRWGIVALVAFGCSGAGTQTAPREETPPADRVVADQPGIGGKCAPRKWPADSCRANKQCEYGCVAPIDAPMQYGDCSCPAGQVCFVQWMGMGAKQSCGDDCTKSGCRDGFRCTKTGHCELVPCTEGYTCTAQARCEPSHARADRHGCVPLACNGDGDCPCDAFCVLGACYAKPGRCQEPPMG